MHPDLTALLPDPHERARYQDTLRRLSWREVCVPSILRRANLHHREREVRAALANDNRYTRIHRPGPERYQLKPEHRHTARLRAQAAQHESAVEAS